MDLGCIPKSFPLPQNDVEEISIVENDILAECGCLKRKDTPDLPTSVPFPITDDGACRKKLEES